MLIALIWVEHKRINVIFQNINNNYARIHQRVSLIFIQIIVLSFVNHKQINRNLDLNVGNQIYL